MTIEIVPAWWQVLLAVTVLSVIWPAMHKWDTSTGYIPLPDFEGLGKWTLWLIANLVMWLIYFIAV